VSPPEPRVRAFRRRKNCVATGSGFRSARWRQGMSLRSFGRGGIDVAFMKRNGEVFTMMAVALISPGWGRSGCAITQCRPPMCLSSRSRRTGFSAPSSWPVSKTLSVQSPGSSSPTSCSKRR
jgi:hypothetical protein